MLNIKLILKRLSNAIRSRSWQGLFAVNPGSKLETFRFGAITQT